MSLSCFLDMVVIEDPSIPHKVIAYKTPVPTQYQGIYRLQLIGGDGEHIWEPEPIVDEDKYYDISIKLVDESVPRDISEDGDYMCYLIATPSLEQYADPTKRFVTAQFRVRIQKGTFSLSSATMPTLTTTIDD